MQSVPRSRYPHPGWVEQDADEIWQAQIYAARPCWTVRACGLRLAALRDHQSARDHRRLGPRDRTPGRSGHRLAMPPHGGDCAELAQRPRADASKRSTGSSSTPIFPPARSAGFWTMPDARAKARNGEFLFGNIDTWLIWKLTGRRRARHRSDQCFAHHADGSGNRRVGRRLLRHFRRAARDAAADRAFRARGHRGFRAAWARTSPSPESRAISRRLWRGRRASARGSRKIPMERDASP